jgi:CRISPR-associated protein Cas5h
LTLVFDVWGDLAMFRKPYTTTSMVSFPFPPPTAVCGLIAAIVGLDHGASEGALKAEYWDRVRGMQVALGLRRPVAWFSTAVNLIKFKSPSGDMGEHIQVKHQLLKRPAYRIYVRGGEVYDELKKRLERQEFIFTPYLGVAFALAEYSYVGEFRETPVEEEAMGIDSVLPLYGDVRLDLQQSGCLHSEVVPFRLDGIRRQQETVNVIYPEYRVNSRIYLRNRGDVEVSLVGTERVAWFEPW